MKKINKIRDFLYNFTHKTNKFKEDFRLQKKKELSEIENIDREIWSMSGRLLRKTKQDFTIWVQNYFMFWIVWWIIIYVWYLFYQTLSLLYLVFAAYIISIAMESIIDIFQSKMNRSVAIIFSYFLFILFLLSWFFMIIPFILNQSADIMNIILDKIEKFQLMLKYKWLEVMIIESNLLPWYVKNQIIAAFNNPNTVAAIQSGLQENVSNILSFGSQYIRNIWSLIVSIVTWFFSALFQIILVLVLAVFFSLEKEWVIKFLSSFSSNKKYFRLKLQKIYKKLWFRLKWQFVLSLFIWFTVRLLLHTLSVISFIDIPNKATLAIIAWITEFVPFVWPFLWAVPAVLVAITSYWFTWFVVVSIMYYIIQWFENNVLVPVVMNRALWLSPLVIFVAMMLWWAVLWFVWVLLSVPIAVIATIAFEDFIKDK